MTSSSWFPFAAVLAALILVVMIIGAAVTSSVTDTLPAGSATYASVHRTVAWIAGMLAVVLALVIVATGAAAGNARGVAFAAVAAFAVVAILGLASLRGAPVGARIAHACVAPIFLTMVVVLTVMGGKAWNRGPEFVQDYGWPSLRSMGIAAPILVLLQIAMGAAFRHQAMGVMPHIVGAMVVALFIMIAGAFVMHQFPTHKTLRPTALALMVITGIQVFLGMGSFIMRMVSDAGSPALIWATVGHVVMGAVTLAVSTVMMVQIRRQVTPKAKA